MDIEITQELIKKVAKNACLDLTEEEITSFEQDFKDILSYFEILAKADVPNTPSFHPVPIKDALREDEIKPSAEHEIIMINVKEKSDGYIRGPKVV